MVSNGITPVQKSFTTRIYIYIYSHFQLSWKVIYFPSRNELLNSLVCSLVSMEIVENHEGVKCGYVNSFSL